MDRKNKLLWMCWLVYTASYIGRTGYSANISTIIDRFGIVNATAGLVGTFFFFAYACGQLLHGTFCKFYPKRSVISAVLLISAAINAALFMEPAFGVYKYLWLLNGICLSVLWPSLIFTLSLPGNDGNVDRVTFVMSTPTLVGTFVTYGASALFNQLGLYRYFFLAAAILSVCTAIGWFLSFPRLNAAQDYEKPHRRIAVENEKEKKKIATALLVFLVVLGISTAVNSLIKDGLGTWVPKILKDQYGMSDSLSIILTLVLPVCGLFGTALLIGLSRLIRNNLMLCGTMFFSMSAFIAVIVLITRQDSGVTSPVPLLACFGLVYCITFVINTLATAKLPLELRGALNSGLICGIMNSCSYAGSTVSSYALGSISDAGGWNAVFRVLLCATAGSMVLVFLTFFFQKMRSFPKTVDKETEKQYNNV